MKPGIVKDSGFSERVSEEDMMMFRRVCPDKPFAKGDLVFRAGTRGEYRLNLLALRDLSHHIV